MVEEETHSAPPAMWFHIEKLYEAMEKESQSSEGAILYEGFISKLTTSLNIPVPYYGKVLALLKRMGCITQERRGGGTTPSMWRLWRKPTLDDFLKAHEEEKSNPKQDRKSELEQKVSDIQKSLGGIDVPQAIADLQRQINKLKEEPVNG